MEPWTWILKPGSRTVPPWCSVFHQSTEKCTIGMSTAMSSAATAQRRARTCRVGRHPPQRQVADLEQEQQRGRGQPGVPGPPDAPDRAAPQRAGDEGQRGEHRADLDGGRRPGGPRRTSGCAATGRAGCPPAATPPDPVQRDGGDGRVDVEQPGQVPLDCVGRGDPEPEPHGEAPVATTPSDADDGRASVASGRATERG